MPRPLIVAVITFDRFSPFTASALPHLWRQDDARPVVVRAETLRRDDTRQPASSQGFRMGPTMAWGSAGGGYHHHPLLARSGRAPRPAPCSMPGLPPGSGAQIVGLCLGTTCWPTLACWTGAVPPPIWEFEQEFVQRFGAARYQCALRPATTGSSPRLAPPPPGLLPSIWFASISRQPDCHQAGRAAGGASPPGGGQASLSAAGTRLTRDARISQLFDHLRLHLAAPIPWTAWRNIA